MNKNKGIAPLVLMIILAILLVSGYIGYRYFFPAQNLCWPYCQNMTDQDREDIKKSALETQTSDWKVYRNEKYGFEFKYPPTYTAKTENSGRNTIVFGSDELTFGVFVPNESEKMGFLANGLGNEYDLRFSGNGVLFRQILSTFRFTK